MSTVQRWQTPACLSLVLVAAILFVFSLGLRVEARPIVAQSPVAAVTAAPTVCPAVPVAATTAPPPALVPAGINQNVSGSSNLAVAGRGNQTQGNDGGFGDVGMQFQNVNVLAPINIVHISNEGNGNTNNVNFGPSGPVITPTPTSTPTTLTPATADPATTTRTDPNSTATTLPTRVWTPPTAPTTTTTTAPASTPTATP